MYVCVFSSTEARSFGSPGAGVTQVAGCDHLIWLLGIKLWSSVRGHEHFNCRAISLASALFFPEKRLPVSLSRGTRWRRSCLRWGSSLGVHVVKPQTSRQPSSCSFSQPWGCCLEACIYKMWCWHVGNLNLATPTPTHVLLFWLWV